MTRKLTGKLAMTFCLLLPCHGQNTQVEPNAGSWKTWIISSGRDHGVPPPPNAEETKAELAWLRDFSAPTSPEIQQQVAYWDAGAPAYRWLEIINQKAFNGLPLTAFPHRVYAYVNIAMYDATVAAWQAKYTYNRPRPNVLDPSLATKLPTPNSPSYPSEHAATAAAAAAVLAHFFPAEAASFNAMAEEASGGAGRGAGRAHHRTRAPCRAARPARSARARGRAGRDDLRRGCGAPAQHDLLCHSRPERRDLAHRARPLRRRRLIGRGLLVGQGETIPCAGRDGCRARSGARRSAPQPRLEH